jgi:hypothetical protein
VARLSVIKQDLLQKDALKSLELITMKHLVRLLAIRAALSVVANEGLTMKQFDVKTAFLNGEIEEELYMQQPEGYADGSQKVCRLKKSLYGLKQSPRCWNRRLVSFMVTNGFTESAADPCLFVQKSNGTKLIVVVYVDDGLVIGSDTNEIDKILTKLRNEFQITIGSADSYLGMQISRSDDGSVCLHQAHYAKKMLEKFGLDEANPVQIPIDKDCYTNDSATPLTCDIPYREAVGSLMYLATATRPDLSFSVGFVARNMQNPTINDWNRVKKILRYVKGTINQGIVYKRGETNGIMKAYCDSDYASDCASRKSTSGIVCKYAGGAITWKSRKQQSIALSTTEAEFMAACEAAKEVVWLTKLFEDISSLRETPVIQIDNQGAIKLIRNPEFHSRTKHIDVKYCFIREKVQEGKIDVAYISTEHQIADVFTKPLAKERFQVLRKQLGMIDVNDFSI